MSNNTFEQALELAKKCKNYEILGGVKLEKIKEADGRKNKNPNPDMHYETVNQNSLQYDEKQNRMESSRV